MSDPQGVQGRAGEAVSLIVNPGSGPVQSSGVGWTNTYGKALEEAQRWLADMRGEGLVDIEMTEPQPDDCREGRWTFQFRHTVTGVVVTLDTHGVDDADAYTSDGHIFGLPRVYWRGWSSAEPDLADWSGVGFEPVQTWRTLT